jgi:hypothetical protein
VNLGVGASGATPNCKPIGTKWVWKNKEGENGEVVRNVLRLVA